MRVGILRAGAYLTVGVAFYLALRFTPQLPERRPAEMFIQQAATPSWALRLDTLHRGENLQVLLRQAGLADSSASAALRAATSLDHRRIPAEMQVSVRSAHPDSAPSEVVLQLTMEKRLVLRRQGASWTGAEEKLPWTVDTIAVSGTIHSNLYAAVDESAKELLPKKARDELTWSLADVFEYRVDMSRDLQRGDGFKVIAERSRAPNGAMKIDRIVAASFSLSGSVIRAVRFASQSATGDFFDEQGRSMRAAFLRAPLEFRRISSGFGNRKHPILGDIRKHTGLDYAAASGTPVRAIGDGVVVRVGWGNGYGNVIEVRHEKGLVTRYGHLSAFVKGLRTGQRVMIGEQIGFVGSTGLSTGPHLHFEVLVNGVQRDPRTALERRGGAPIPAEERAAFFGLRDQLLATLDGVAAGAQALATR